MEKNAEQRAAFLDLLRAERPDMAVACYLSRLLCRDCEECLVRRNGLPKVSQACDFWHRWVLTSWTAS